MIWLLLSILTFFAVPGDNVTITISEAAILQTSDECVYFVESMNNSAFLPAGVHLLKVGATCQPGVKYVTANNLKIAEIMVKTERNSDKLFEYAVWLESKLKEMKSEFLSLRDEINETTEKLRKAELEKEKLEKEKRMLELELKDLNETYNSLVLKYGLLGEELENKTSKIAQMESEIKSLSEQSTTYRIATFFLVSLFIGSFTAMVWISRKS